MSSRVYVANSRDGTVSVLAPGEQGIVGAPIPAGPAPRQALPVPPGRLLVLSVPLVPHDTERLAALARTARGWERREIALEPRARNAALAGGGGTFALSYHVPTPVGTGTPVACRVALLDTAAGRVERLHSPCAPGERVTALAVANIAAGPLALLGIWGGEVDPRGGAGGGNRLALMDLRTGAVRARQPLEGVVVWVIVAASNPDTAYVGVSDSAPAPEGAAARRSLLWVDTLTLSITREAQLPTSLGLPAVVPDGATAFGLDPPGEHLIELDLATGAEHVAMALNAPAASVAVDDAWIYLAVPRANRVLVVDWATFRQRRSVRVGTHPIGVTVGPAI